MPNMSYCRFQNTLNDLRDCEEALADGDELSAEEARAAKKLLNLCADISGTYSEEDIEDMEEKCDDCGKPYRNDNCGCE
jgi:hypothetical protein